MLDPKKQRIRSYVRREGRMTPSQRQSLDTLWPSYGIDYKAQPVDLLTVFGRDAKRVLEIGFGNGESLATMAREAPDVDFIGVEVHRPGVGHLLSLIERDGLQNVRIICYDIVPVLQKMLPRHCIDRVQIFFPDPWPKLKHHKRRLIQSTFLQTLANLLKPGGIVHLATDWENYAQHMLQVLSSFRAYSNLSAPDVFCKNPYAFRPMTKFERRGLRLGHAIYDLMFRIK